MNFLELTKRRCSVRKYASRPVETEKLDYILEAARMAPSAVNYQPWCFLVVKSDKGREKIQSCYPREWFKQAPCYIVVCGDHAQSWKRADGKDHMDIDAAIAAEHICLAAAEQGLGSCWVCNFDVALCRQQFGLPPTVEPVVLIPVGYPEDEALFEATPKHRKERSKLSDRLLYVEMVLLAIGLAMDSLAVSVTGGALAQQRCGFYKVFKVASVMALFQAGMTLIGFFAGKGFERYIEAFDHWVAFVLLLYLGGKMIYDSMHDDEEECRFDIFRGRTLCGLGVATSIDALAVGISLAIIKAPIVAQTVIIGLVTFAFAAFGVFFGNRVGGRINLKLDLIGGIILIGIGTRILIEHLFFS